MKILWDNINEGHEHNFNKYNHSVVTDFGTEYDYGSVMHYSEKAFSKNGEPTIESLVIFVYCCLRKFVYLFLLQKKGVQLGQRKGMSETDITKLNKMYQNSCHKEPTAGSEKDILQEIIDWFKKYL